MGRLEHNIAVITGAAMGIGAEIARLFATEGAFVIVTDILDEQGLEISRSINGRYFHLDVALESEWNALAKLIEQDYERIDVLVNNAGITGFAGNMGQQDPENADLESWHEVHAVNLDGVFLGCKTAIKLMKNKGGAIINISSRSGMVGIPAAAAYASSKAAVRNHTKTVALYCAEKRYKIRCNSIHPAAILTSLWDPMFGNDETIRQERIANIESGIPLGHMGEPIDVAYAALFLASKESKYITGAELTIDGGILAGSSAQPSKN